MISEQFSAVSYQRSARAGGGGGWWGKILSSGYNERQTVKMMTVNEFIKQRVLPQHKSIIALIRKVMREAAPEAQELISYGLPMWKRNNILAWISPNKRGITFGFTYGTEFEDKYKLLQGVGKAARHVKIADVKDVNKAALRYYIKQALKIDKGK